MAKLLGSLSCEERLRKLHLSSLEKRRLGTPYHLVPVFKGWRLRRRRCPVHKESYGKVRSDVCKLHLGRFQLDGRGKLCTMRAIGIISPLCGKWWIPQHWTLKIQLDRVMGHLIQTMHLPAKTGPDDR